MLERWLKMSLKRTTVKSDPFAIMHVVIKRHGELELMEKNRLIVEPVNADTKRHKSVLFELLFKKFVLTINVTSC